MPFIPSVLFFGFVLLSLNHLCSVFSVRVAFNKFKSEARDLIRNIDDPNSTVLFVGFQADHTLIKLE